MSNIESSGYSSSIPNNLTVHHAHREQAELQGQVREAEGVQRPQPGNVVQDLGGRDHRERNDSEGHEGLPELIRRLEEARDEDEVEQPEHQERHTEREGIQKESSGYSLPAQRYDFFILFLCRLAAENDKEGSLCILLSSTQQLHAKYSNAMK